VRKRKRSFSQLLSLLLLLLLRQQRLRLLLGRQLLAFQAMTLAAAMLR
jgi:hypothetical protein